MNSLALDGPAGAGKSTVARLVAARLGWRYIDTGAMYRAIALAALERGIGLDDGASLGRLANDVTVEVSDDSVMLDGVDVSERIRSDDVTAAVSKVSAHPEVRRSLVAKQRGLAAKENVVMEGRDIGTAVLPDARVKVFLDASLDERARRRWLERPSEERPDLAEVRANINARDDADSTRAESPLVKPPGAVVLDTTELDTEGVVEAILSIVESELGGD